MIRETVRLVLTKDFGMRKFVPKFFLEISQTIFMSEVQTQLYNVKHYRKLTDCSTTSVLLKMSKS